MSASYMNIEYLLRTIKHRASALRQRTVKNARATCFFTLSHPFILSIIQWVDKVPIKMTLSKTKLLLLIVLVSSVFSRPQENRRQGKVLVGKLHIPMYDI